MASTDACEWSAAEVAAYVRDGRLRQDVAWIPHVPDFDTHTFASKLEAEGVYGHVLLSTIDRHMLRDDFGIKTIGVQSAISSAIAQLRRNSPLLSNFGQGNNTVSASHLLPETTVATKEPLDLQSAIAETSIGTNTRGVEYIEQDASGRKRRKLNLLEPALDINATKALPSAPANVTDLPPRYSSEKLTSVDQTLYGNTPFGQEINLELPEALESDTFSIIADPYRNPDIVQCVGRRIKRFLNAPKDNITFHGEPAVAIKPYPDATPKGRRRKPRADQIIPDVPPHSVTVIQEQSNGEATAMRMDAHTLHLQKHENVVVSEHPSELSYLLDKWGNMEDDELLPTLADDNQSITSSLQAEIEEDVDDTTAAGRSFTQDQARQIIDEAIDAITNAWKEKKLPSLEKNEAWGLWQSTRGRRSIRDAHIETVQTRIAQLQTRLSRAIDEILLSSWSSKVKLTRQCGSIDVTVEQIAEETWKIEVLQRDKEPEHVRPNKRAAPRAKDGAKSARKTSSLHNDFIMEDLPERDDESVLVEDDRLDLHHQKKSIDEVSLETADDESPSSPVVNNGEDAQSSVSRLASDLPGISHTGELQHTQPQQEVEIVGEHAVLKDENEDHESDNDLPSPSQLTRPTQPVREEQPPHEVIVLSSDTPSPTPQSPKPSSSKAPMTQKVPRLVLSAEGNIEIYKDPLDATMTVLSDERKLEIHENPFDATMEEIKSLTWLEIEIECPSKPQLIIKVVYEKMDSDQRKILLPYISRGSISSCIKDVTGIVDNFQRTQGPSLGRNHNESLAIIYAARLYLCWCNDDADFWTYTPDECREFHEPCEYDDSSFRRWHNILLKALQKAERFIEKVITVSDDSDEADEVELVTKKGKKRVVRKDKSAEKLRKQALQRQENLPQQTSHDGKVSQMIAAGRLDGNEVVLFAPYGTDPSQHVYLNKYFSQKFLPHQIQGVRFMWRELTVPDNEGGQGAILAHHMGIGKTAQAIALLVTIAEVLSSDEKRALIPQSMREQRTLILCPANLIFNWKEELLKWDFDRTLGHAYSVDATETSTQHRLTELRAWKAGGGILLIGFTLFERFVGGTTRNDMTTEEKDEVSEILLQVPTLVITDEAHALKNKNSKTSLCAKRLVTERRVGLTATPISNNIQEIFSLINWAAPGYLGSADEFKAFWADPIEKGAYLDADEVQRRRSMRKLASLNKVITPKLDRADDQVLEKALDPKIEFVITLPLTEIQTQIYRKLVLQQRSSRNTDGLEEHGVASTKLFGWLGIVRLLTGHPSMLQEKLLEKPKPRRKEVVSPRLTQLSDTYGEPDVEIVEGPKAGDEPVAALGMHDTMIKEILEGLPEEWETTHSYKAELVRRIIHLSVQAGDKVLLFSGSIPSLNYLTLLLKNRDWRTGRIEGSMSQTKRQDVINNMKDGHYDVLLISTKAGGQGLNIQSANRIIIFDFGFNPQLESQAIARSYRIGQTKPTFVYRFVAGGTSEEVLYDKALFKTLLASRVVDMKNPTRNAKREPREWLNLPGLVPQEDLTAELGKDPLVLDHILAQSKDDGSFIRSIKTEETLSKEADDQPLTDAEQREVEEEIAHAAIMSGKEKGKGRAL